MKTKTVNVSPPIPYLAKFWFSNYGPKMPLFNQIACFL